MGTPIACVLAVPLLQEEPDALQQATDLVTRAKDWLLDPTGGIAVGLSIVKAVLIVVAAMVLAEVVGGIARRAMNVSRLKFSDLLKDFFVNTAKKVVVIVGFVIALGALGVDIGPLVAGIGVAGFVIGFALQETLGNFAAGIMILLYRPYDIGDVIEAAGQTGKVDSMNLVSTIMLTPDNQRLVVPNGSIWGGVIRNVTASPTRRVDMSFGIAYGDDSDQAASILMQILAAHPLVLKDPAPEVKLAELGESSVNFVVRPWCRTPDYWTVKFDVTRAVKQRFDAEGITIPFPQRDVHLHQAQA